MKRIFTAMLAILLMGSYSCPMAFAVQEVKKPASKTAKANVSKPKLEIAFVFDSNAEKTNELVKQYKPIITKSLARDYKAVFSDDLIFKGNWTEASAIAAAKKALQSRARMIVCFGYWSGEYLKKANKTKNVITVDQYAIRSFSDKFFNPVQQSVNDFVVFQRLVPNMGKTAILMNERVYNTKKNWNDVRVEYKPKRYKQTEAFIFITGPEAWDSWTVNCEYTDFDKLKAFLLKRQLDRLTKKNRADHLEV